VTWPSSQHRRSSRCGGRATTISSLATYVPPKLVTNADLEKMVETTDGWIRERTGIRERYMVDRGVATSDLAKEAAVKAIERAGLSPNDIGFIVVGTVTPDMMFPSTACLLQQKIGARHAWGFDLSAACSAFTYAVTTASQIVSSGAHDHALVVGADVMSSIIDYQDRSTCVLFGDGAGAVVISAANSDRDGAILDFEHEIDGRGSAALCMPAGGSRQPASHETIDARLHCVKQDGPAVFKFAVRKMEEITHRILERNNVAPADLDLFVAHQANRRIIMSATEKLGINPKKVVINIDRFGNTTAASIPLALDDAATSGRLNRGDLVLLVSVGAGFTAGSVLMRWGIPRSLMAE
jgi:3-oxoacyl-[acyl-carrier-protein] synthase-3